MADRSAIEWTDATWNPIRARSLLAKGGIGWHCEKVSDGCRNCYAEPMNRDRFGTGLAYKPGNTGKVDIYLDEDVLRRPLSWRRPRRVFPGSMTDIFGDWVSDQMLDRIFATMILTPQHTYQVLTKRSARMREYVGQWFERLAHNEVSVDHPTGRANFRDLVDWHVLPTVLPNVWLGVSTEDQRSADERVPDLLATPAAIRFVSAEPLLGSIDFEPWLACPRHDIDVNGQSWGCQGCDSDCPSCPKGKAHYDYDEGPVDQHGMPEWITERRRTLDWIIAGGESGPNARPMHPDWARSLRDQCAAAGVAYLFKQHGEWLHEDQVRDGQHPGARFFLADGSPVDEAPPFGPATGRLWHWWAPDHKASIRIGKAHAGRLLDGVEHNAMPEVR